MPLYGPPAAAAGAAGGGGLTLPLAMVSGRWYGPESTFPFASPNSSWAPLADQLLFVPVFVPAAVTVSALATAVATALTAQAYRLGVYASDAPTGRPGALLLDAGEVDGIGTGLRSVTGLTLALPGGAWVFLAVWAKLTGGALTGFSAGNVRMPNMYGVTAATDATTTPLPFQSLAFGGALPDPAATGAGLTTSPVPLLRFLVA